MWEKIFLNVLKDCEWYNFKLVKVENYIVDGGYKVMKEFLVGFEFFDVVMVINDVMVVGVLCVLYEVYVVILD